MDRFLTFKKKMIGGVKPMTICLSAICNNGAGIVFCADRMVTVGGRLTFEQARAKFGLASSKTKNCVILNAGDSYNANKIVLEVGEILDKEISKGKKFTIMEISEVIKNVMKNLRKEKIDSQILNSRGLKIDTFYMNLNKYPESFWREIDKQISEYSLGVEFLVVGFDVLENDKQFIPHINLIEEDEQIEVLDGDGFGIIGIGNIMSLPEITKEPYAWSTPMSEAIVKVYWAKKSAERVVSVGSKSTDLGALWCISNPQTGDIEVRGTQLQQSFLDELNKNYDASLQKMKETILEIEKNINDIFSGKKNLVLK